MSIGIFCGAPDSAVAAGVTKYRAVFGERHLRLLLNSYQEYYNETRTHLSLRKDAPVSRAGQAVGKTFAVPILGGLHHQYIRA